MQILISEPCLFLQPVAIPLMRFGVKSDSGYVGSESCLIDPSSVLSFGLKDDWSFEQTVFELLPNANIHSYDPSVSLWSFIYSLAIGLKQLFLFRDLTLWGRLKVLVSYLRFFNRTDRRHIKLLVNDEYVEGKSVTFDRAVEEIPVEHNLILKMDIEGDEYKVLPEVLNSSSLSRITAVLLSFMIWVQDGLNLCG